MTLSTPLIILLIFLGVIVVAGIMTIIRYKNDQAREHQRERERQREEKERQAEIEEANLRWTRYVTSQREPHRVSSYPSYPSAGSRSAPSFQPSDASPLTLTPETILYYLTLPDDQQAPIRLQLQSYTLQGETQQYEAPPSSYGETQQHEASSSSSYDSSSHSSSDSGGSSYGGSDSGE